MFINRLRHGLVFSIAADGSKYRGEFFKGKFQGKAVYISSKKQYL